MGPCPGGGRSPLDDEAPTPISVIWWGHEQARSMAAGPDVRQGFSVPRRLWCISPWIFSRAFRSTSFVMKESSAWGGGGVMPRDRYSTCARCRNSGRRAARVTSWTASRGCSPRIAHPGGVDVPRCVWPGGPVPYRTARDLVTRSDRRYARVDAYARVWPAGQVAACVIRSGPSCSPCRSSGARGIAGRYSGPSHSVLSRHLARRRSTGLDDSTDTCRGQRTSRRAARRNPANRNPGAGRES
ncbi:hypothetical protein MLGJGCBP_05072 [Rhodococcus sp. T7]|nr:hypothetical protein MLGJGCBP_05072 [Rhodococcus sp. T7]